MYITQWASNHFDAKNTWTIIELHTLYLQLWGLEPTTAIGISWFGFCDTSSYQSLVKSNMASVL